jgi:hypothetical protein
MNGRRCRQRARPPGLQPPPAGNGAAPDLVTSTVDVTVPSAVALLVTLPDGHTTGTRLTDAWIAAVIADSVVAEHAGQVLHRCLTRIPCGWRQATMRLDYPNGRRFWLRWFAPLPGPADLAEALHGAAVLGTLYNQLWRRTWRHGPCRVHLTVDTGPPRWWWPRLDVWPTRWGVTVQVGWWLTAVMLTVTFGQPTTPRLRRGGDAGRR